MNDTKPKTNPSFWTAAVIGSLTIAAIVWAISDVASLPSAPEAVAAASVLPAVPRPAPAVAAAPAQPAAPDKAPVDSIPVADPAATVQVAPPAAPIRVAAPAAPRLTRPAGPDRRAPPKAEKSRQATEERQRLVNDTRIRTGVIERLAANRATIHGRIGVESRDAVVRLTGYTQTAGQAQRAEREARKVRGVRAVRNEIRPRIGGSR